MTLKDTQGSSKKTKWPGKDKPCKVCTVPAPINGAACIQKLFVDPSDYHIKIK